MNKIETGYNHPFVLPEAVEQGIEINTSLDAALRRWEICAAVPLVIESKEIVGVLILGKKLSGLRYSPSDMELLNILTSQIAVAVRRLQLQEKLVLEEIENTRLEELNMLKSYFVSSVSHDLKTPLTSIKMFAEMLGSAKKLSAKKKKDYTHIIEGESDRLTRLIDNVLEFSKIEKGISDYDFLEVDLNELVKDVLNSLQYQFEMQNFEVKIKYSPEKNLITADRDAVTGSMINILSNAVKFSNRKKRVEVAVFQKNGFAGFKVRDEGIGISEAGLSSIFEPFYRSNEEHSERIKGTGLGLSIVKHVMDAHHGKIEVKSKPGKGSTFTLLFPIK